MRNCILILDVLTITIAWDTNIMRGTILPHALMYLFRCPTISLGIRIAHGWFVTVFLTYIFTMFLTCIGGDMFKCLISSYALIYDTNG